MLEPDQLKKDKCRAKAVEKLYQAIQLIKTAIQHPLHTNLEKIEAQMESYCKKALLLRQRRTAKLPDNAGTVEFVFRGVFFKLGRVVKNWKERLILLQDTAIKYYAPEKDGVGVEKGTILLSDIYEVSEVYQSVPEKPVYTGFYIFTSSRKWMFVAVLSIYPWQG
jgi:hypothetical protein